MEGRIIWEETDESMQQRNQSSSKQSINNVEAPTYFKSFKGTAFGDCSQTMTGEDIRHESTKGFFKGWPVARIEGVQARPPHLQWTRVESRSNML